VPSLICGMGLLWLAGLVVLGIVLLFLLSRQLADTDRYTNIESGSEKQEDDEQGAGASIPAAAPKPIAPISLARYGTKSARKRPFPNARSTIEGSRNQEPA
jgi:hypothetical protein